MGIRMLHAGSHSGVVTGKRVFMEVVCAVAYVVQTCVVVVTCVVSLRLVPFVGLFLFLGMVDRLLVRHTHLHGVMQ